MDLTIVAGASSNHFQCLGNLLHTIKVFEPEATTIVYDLGLTESESREVSSKCMELRKFNFEKYPPHVNIQIDRGQYAWKPILISEVISERRGLTLYLDAGDLLLSKLSKVREILTSEGFFSPVSFGQIGEYTHPGTVSFLRADDELLSRRNRNGAIVGFNADIPAMVELAERWKECALTKECIAPEGSNRSNHRQDQSVLGILTYQFQQRHKWKLTDDVTEISVQNDKVPPSYVDEWLKERSRSTHFASAALKPLHPEMVTAILLSRRVGLKTKSVHLKFVAMSAFVKLQRYVGSLKRSRLV